MDVREIELPGIGRKYALRTETGDRMTIIIHNSGHREIYLFDDKAEFPSSAVRLSDVDGRRLGAILGGAFYQPVGEADLATILGKMTIDWKPVPPAMVGKTIGELAIRNAAGANVIAILRGDQVLPNPAPETVLQPLDTLVVVGTRDQAESFRLFSP